MSVSGVVIFYQSVCYYQYWPGLMSQSRVHTCVYNSPGQTLSSSAPHRMLSSDLTTPVSACKLSLDSVMDVLTALWLSPRIPLKFYRTLPIRLCMSLSISFFIGGDWYRNMLQQCTTCLLGASWPEFPVTIQMEMSRSWAVSEQLQLVWELRTDNSHWRPLLPSAVIPPGSEPAPSKIFQHRFSIFN